MSGPVFDYGGDWLAWRKETIDGDLLGRGGGDERKRTERRGYRLLLLTLAARLIVRRRGPRKSSEYLRARLKTSAGFVCAKLQSSPPVWLVSIRPFHSIRFAQGCLGVS